MRLAVVLFNLGGPDRLEAVAPFLRNLFSDPAILTVPALLRPLLARVISRRRAPVARAIYQQIGGRSPILEQTKGQADALKKALALSGTDHVEVFIAMRYWHPLIDETVAKVKAFGPDRVFLLPLYPQFSTTTTGSSLTAWRKTCLKQGLKAAETTLCCWPEQEGFCQAMARKTLPFLESAAKEGRPRLLFSAHGLPKSIVARGDPYPDQVARTAQAIVANLKTLLAPAGDREARDFDWQVCYQSRVGPLAWLEPSTEMAIEKAAHDQVPVIVIPLAFVSEHSETLVELDREYRTKAAESGVPAYFRVPTVGDDAIFIESMARTIRDNINRNGIFPERKDIFCSDRDIQCPCYKKEEI